MKFIMSLVLLGVSAGGYAACRSLVSETPGCPDNWDLKVCEDRSVQEGISISSSEAEWLLEFKTTWCGVFRGSDQAYCMFEEVYPGRSPHSTGDLLKVVLTPIDPDPVPTYDLSGSLTLTLANGKSCSYKLL